MVEFVRLLELQEGVISRRQLLAIGTERHDLQRLVRRRELTPVLRGTYVNHTGQPSWTQRAWAAVLCCAPSVLDAESALRAHLGGRWRGYDESGPIRVAIDHSRRQRPPSGVLSRRVVGLDRLSAAHLSPPRLAVEHATLAALTNLTNAPDRVGLIAQTINARATTPARLLSALDSHRRVPERDWIKAVLADVRDGANSVLEHAYLTRVERAHGLPKGRRQVRANAFGRQVIQDVDYEPFGLVVELDGRADHSSVGARTSDLDRDLALTLAGRASARLGWGQVFADSCRTADRIGSLLQARGWPGFPAPCCPTCVVQASTGNIRFTG